MSDPVRRSSIVAALLSFILPGLGHGWLGAFRRGLVLALPVLVLAGFAGGTYLVQGRARTLGLLLQPGVLVALLVANAAMLVWRSAAIVDAFRLGMNRAAARPSARYRRIGTTLIGLLLLATVAMHGAVGYVGFRAYDTVSTVFATPGPTPVAASVAPTGSAQPPASQSGTPVPTPSAAPGWSGDGRLDVLLVGGDAGPGRASLRTDSMILLSVETGSGRAALFGLPRNLRNVPLPPGPAALFPECGCFPEMLNSLFRFAMDRPQQFRGGDARGYLALQDAVGALTGREIDGMVVVTLAGFVRLVDALGGIDVTTPYSLYDASYPHEDGIHHEEVWIPAGAQHLDGHLALAYARSRHQDSDYDRMFRQQLILTALRRQVCPGDLVLRVPELLDIARDSLWTNLPIDQLPDLLELGNRVRTDRITRHQFWPPDIPDVLTPQAIASIRAQVAEPWGASGAPGPSSPAVPAPDPC